MVLMGIRDDLISAIKKGEVTVVVVAEFSKAFDTVYFGTLLTKLYTLGFSKSFLTWLTSYLSSRSQYVQINDRFLSSHKFQFGVLQSSILGPMLFIGMLLNILCSIRMQSSTRISPLSPSERFAHSLSTSACG